MAHTTAQKEKQQWPGRATHLALRAANWDEFLDIAAAVRGYAGRENVTSCGATSRRLQHRWQFWSWTVCPYSEITCRSCMVFMARFDGVHAFGYNSAGSEAIWMKIGALWVYCLPLALARDTLPSVTWRITLNHPSTTAMRLMSNYFHHLLYLDAHIDIAQIAKRFEPNNVLQAFHTIQQSSLVCRCEYAMFRSWEMWYRVRKSREKWSKMWCFFAPQMFFGRAPEIFVGHNKCPTNISGHHFWPKCQVWLRSHGWSFIYADKIIKEITAVK